MPTIRSFQDRSRSEQITLIVIAVAILAALLTAIYFYWRTSYTVLFKDMRSSDASTIVSQLESEKIPYQLKDDGATVLVPDAIAQSTRLKLANQSLPLKGTVGFELFNKADLGLTEFAQKINYQRALQGELARTIMSLSSVETARVHLALPDTSLFRRDAGHPTASVTLAGRGGTALSDDSVRGIQKLVAASVPNLHIEDVAVFDQKGALVSRDVQNLVSQGSVSVSQNLSQFVQQKNMLESAYTQKIQQLLDPIYGNSAISATVDVSLEQPKAQAVTTDTGETSEPVASTGPATIRMLSVAIVVRAPLSEQAKTQIHDLVGSAVGLDPRRGDTLTVFVPTTSAAAPQQSLTSVNTAWSAAKMPTPLMGNPWLWLGGGLLATLMLVGAFWRGRTRLVPSLSQAERDAHVAHLRSLLAEAG